MIKLASIVTEEKEAFQKEREGKTSFSVKDNDNEVIIRLYVDDFESQAGVFQDDPRHKQIMGQMTLLKNCPYQDLGTPPCKPNYLFVDKVTSNVQKQGYGFLMYKKALVYAQGNRFKGLSSSKVHRSGSAEDVWNKLKTSDDKYYDYVDISLLKNLKETLTEMPVGHYQTIGNFDKGASFRDKRDRDLITHPVAIQKVKDFFQNTSTDFDFYFVNSKGVRKFTEMGRAKPDFVFANYPDGLGIKPEQLKDGQLNGDNITVFFVGNTAAEKVPMTAWTIAHRFGHVIRREHSFQTLINWLDEEFKEILEMYNVTNSTHQYASSYYSDKAKFDKVKAVLFNQIGTMRSARQGEIDRYMEFYFELFAQYLKFGHVKFNRLTQTVLKGHAAYGRKDYMTTRMLDSVNDRLDMIERDFRFYADDAISEATGNVYVM